METVGSPTVGNTEWNAFGFHLDFNFNINKKKEKGHACGVGGGEWFGVVGVEY